MSRVELERFVGDVKADPRLQPKLNERGSGVVSIVEIARSCGYEITTKDVRDYVRAQHRDLTEQDLDAVVGGVFRTGMMGGMQMIGFQACRASLYWAAVGFTRCAASAAPPTPKGVRL